MISVVGLTDFKYVPIRRLIRRRQQKRQVHQLHPIGHKFLQRKSLASNHGFIIIWRDIYTTLLFDQLLCPLFSI